jgi:hypothetical protein
MPDSTFGETALDSHYESKYCNTDLLWHRYKTVNMPTSTDIMQGGNAYWNDISNIAEIYSWDDSSEPTPS